MRLLRADTISNLIAAETASSHGPSEQFSAAPSTYWITCITGPAMPLLHGLPVPREQTTEQKLDLTIPYVTLPWRLVVSVAAR